jgi:uncharacterized protein YdeI (YjbR/CyaY-like superfamily)
MAGKDLEQVPVASRTEWRAWLAANHAHAEGVWLVLYKQHVAGKYLPMADVVEEALCFGWIDGLARRLDDDRLMLRLTPRRPGSQWSRVNKARVERLLASGQMQPAGLAAIERAKADGSWTALDAAEAGEVPADLAAALAQNAAAHRHFAAFSRSSRRALIWWVTSARGATTRQKHIAEVVRLAAHNLRANFPEAIAFDKKTAEE